MELELSLEYWTPYLVIGPAGVGGGEGGGKCDALVRFAYFDYYDHIDYLGGFFLVI